MVSRVIYRMKNLYSYAILAFVKYFRAQYLTKGKSDDPQNNSFFRKLYPQIIADLEVYRV
jgi:hypothetical protein